MISVYPDCPLTMLLAKGVLGGGKPDLILPPARNALAQAQQAAAQAIASKDKDGGAAGEDNRKPPVKQEDGADAKDDVKSAQVPVVPGHQAPFPVGTLLAREAVSMTSILLVFDCMPSKPRCHWSRGLATAKPRC